MADNEYHYLECGLPNIYLTNGFEIHKTQYGSTVSIANVKELHMAIACDLANQKSRLTGEEFRFLRKQLNFSQNMIGSLLDREEQTIRNWEHNDIDVPTLADSVIRILFLESVKEDSFLTEMLKKLRKLDNNAHDQKIIFENYNHEWKTKIAA